MKRIFLSLYFIHHLINVCGQGYSTGQIITVSRDTINGFIQTPKSTNISQILFKIEKNGNAGSYSTSDLHGYILDGIGYFEPIVINEEKLFAQLIVRGPINLYRLNSEYLILKEEKIIRLPFPTSEVVNGPNGPVRKVNNEFIGLLNIALQDCKVDLKNIKYTEKLLTKVIQNYNACTGQPGETFNNDIPFTRVSFYATVGYSTDKFNLNNPPFTNQLQSRTNYIPVGFGFEFSSPRINNHFFLTLEAVYQKFLVQGLYQDNFSGSNVSEDVVIVTSAFSFPIGFKYKLFSKNNSPFINAGFISYKILSIEEKVIQEREDLPGNIKTNVMKFDDSEAVLNGIFIGIGYQANVYKKIKLSIEIRVSKNSDFIGQFIETRNGFSNSSVRLGLIY